MAIQFKRSAWVVIGLSVFGLIAFFAWQQTIKEYKALEPPPPQSTQVQWARVHRSDIQDWIYAEGAVRAVRKAYLTFEVEGRVAELMRLPGHGPLQEGMHVQGPNGVSKGQLLARLDDKDYAEALHIARTDKLRAERAADMAAAQLKQSKSNAKLVQSRLKRIRHLLSKGVSSQQEFDETQAQWELAEASVASAQAAFSSAKAAVQATADSVAQASRNFDRTRIYAPWSGTIARLNIREGDYVSRDVLDISHDDAMAATFPMTLIDTSAFEVAVEIPMYQLAQLRPGNPAFVQRQDVSSHHPSATSNLWQPAEVYTVAPMLSPKSRTVRVRIRTKETNPSVLDGELLKTKILRERKRTLVVPVNALIYRENHAQVFVVDPNSQHVQVQVVKTGIREDKRIEILNGLSEGDIIVTDGRQRLINGDRVTLLERTFETEGKRDG